MNYSWKAYLALGIVFLLSLLFSILIPSTQILHEISTIPAVMALIGAVYQIFRDQAAFEKQLLLQQKQNQFTLGAASHMAIVAFDKHVEFCESYIACTRRILDEIYNYGAKRRPQLDDLLHALIDTRQKYEAWLTQGINSQIVNFESKLKEMVLFTELTKDPSSDEERRKLFAKKAMDLYSIFIRDEDDPEIAPDRIVALLQSILGIEELTALRQAVINEAVKVIKSSGKKGL